MQHNFFHLGGFMPPRAVPHGAPDDPGPLGRKVLSLIRLKKHPSGAKYTQKEIAEGVSDLYRKDRMEEALRLPEGEREIRLAEIEREPPLTHRTYIGKILNGTTDNPSLVIIEYLAKWFGVSPSYFFPGEEGDKVAQEVELLTMLQEAKEAGQLEGLSVFARLTTALTPDAARRVMQIAILTAKTARPPENGSAPEGS
ncbi:hypothetical protein ACFZAM_31190 [Streptomyces sp. NPDC008079]|uniref:hypothetical protein n=1 Tax=Streptomyces sp. NPDC008079 TaxID=3364806 RepID=UPI0036E8CCBF